jgi:hypothetical protein
VTAVPNGTEAIVKWAPPAPRAGDTLSGYLITE